MLSRSSDAAERFQHKAFFGARAHARGRGVAFHAARLRQVGVDLCGLAHAEGDGLSVPWGLGGLCQEFGEVLESGTRKLGG